MSRYTFKVIRQGKVVAEATSMREAQKEALRVGGVAARSALQNPAKCKKNPIPQATLQLQRIKNLCANMLDLCKQLEGRLEEKKGKSEKLLALVDLYGISQQLYVLGDQCGEFYYTGEARRIGKDAWNQITAISQTVR